MRTKLMVLSVFTLTVWFLGRGCMPYKSEGKLKKVDTLIHQVKEVEDALNINISTIKNRYDTITRIKGYLEEHLEKQSQSDLESSLLRFEGIAHNYRNFIDNYEVLKYENKRHLKRLKNLKKDIAQGNLKPNTFDSIYRSEKAVIDKHFEKSKRLVGLVTEIENIYRKNHQKLKKVYARLKKHNASDSTQYSDN